MPRPSTVAVIFVVAMNLFALSFGVMGVYDEIGMDDRIQPSDEVDQQAPQYGDDGLETGSGVGGTLFGMYNVLSQGVQGIFATIFPAVDMLVRAGFPGALAYGVISPLFTFVVVFDVLSYIRGWGL